jgi:hypothetical protein
LTGEGRNELSIEEAPVSFELETIQDLRRRLSDWRRAPDLGQDWERGTPTTWIADLLEDWGAAPPADDPSPVPSSVTTFGGERVPFPKPPRELAARYYNVTAWSEHPTGGHFPAVAEPEILANVIRKFFRPLRKR